MGVGWVAPERQQTGEKAGHLEVIHTCAESLKPGSVGVFTPWKSAMLQIRICLPPPPPPRQKAGCQHLASTPLGKLHLGDKLCCPELCEEATAGLPPHAGGLCPAFVPRYFPGTRSTPFSRSAKAALTPAGSAAESVPHPPAPTSSFLRGPLPALLTAEGQGGPADTRALG